MPGISQDLTPSPSIPRIGDEPDSEQIAKPLPRQGVSPGVLIYPRAPWYHFAGAPVRETKFGGFHRLTLGICLAASSVSAVAAWSPPANIDVCWRAANSNLIRVRFVAVSSAYYQFVGKLVEANGLINPIFGSAVVTSTKLIGTSTHSGAAGTNFWGEVGNWSINRTTKALTFKAIGTERASQSHYYTNITVPFVTCPGS